MCEDLSDLGGVAEIAKFFGVYQSAVANWKARYVDWPTSALQLKMGPIYRLSDVDDFIERHPRLLNPKFITDKKEA